MADDDNFDIDIYGDDPNPDFPQENHHVKDEIKAEDGGDEMIHDTNSKETHEVNVMTEDAPVQGIKSEDTAQNRTQNSTPSQQQQQIASTGGTMQNHIQPPKQAPVQQGTQRKAGADNRAVDPGATPAVIISDLHWWNTEDDIRGWVNQAGCEDEMKDITFNEHKVNGKSKGQVLLPNRFSLFILPCCDEMRSRAIAGDAIRSQSPSDGASVYDLRMSR
jgi:hypothetical protein